MSKIEIVVSENLLKTSDTSTQKYIYHSQNDIFLDRVSRFKLQKKCIVF